MHFKQPLETLAPLFLRLMPSASNIRYLAGLLIIGLLLSACQTLDRKTADTTAAPVEDRAGTDDWVAALIADKSPTEAIQILEQKAAQHSRGEAFSLLARATDIAIGIETSTQVDSRLAQLRGKYPDSDFYVRLEILEAKILLSRQQASQVLKSLEKITPRATPSELVDIFDLKAQALEQSGFPVDSARVRVKLDQSLKDLPDRQKANDEALWNNLMGIKPEIISSQISEIPDTFSGWLELANLALQYHNNGTLFNQELEKWVLRHPEHPARRTIIEDIKKRQIATSKHPDHIALILPLSGKLSGVGQAIRDGFLMANLETHRTLGTLTKIDIYDTEGRADLAGHAIQQANKSGAKFIIGPLSKAAVQLAANDPMNNLPLLVLNRVPRDIVSVPDDQPPPLSNSPSLYQFSLAPESEAVQAAERISLDGHQHTMVMVPETVWGNRIYEAFATRYHELGGEILSHQRFPRGAADYSEAIQQGLNLKLSTLRYKQLKAGLRRDIEFTPRRRGDIDGIFIAASPQEARQIKPQLRFYYADNIPVYATSHIFSGKTQPNKDKDLEGIRFCDMPWVLDRTTSPNALSYIIDTAWPDESARYSRFHALGVDSFRLIPHLEWLKSHNDDWLAGFTGRLKINPDGEISRGLQWASFKNGHPLVINDFLSY